MARKFALESWCLSLYLGTAPIYWLPGVPQSVVNATKTILFVLPLGMMFLRVMARGKIYLPKEPWGPIGFLALIVLSTTGLVQATKTSLANVFVVNIMAGAGYMWCFFNLTRQGADVGLIFFRAVVIISFFSTFPVVHRFTGLPDWEAPLSVQQVVFSYSFWTTGFSARRTGWSIGLAFYLPIAIFLFMAKSVKNSVFRQILCITMAGCIFFAQIVSKGRAGILASFITWGAWLLTLRQRLIALVIAVSIAVFSFYFFEVWIETFRLFRLPEQWTDIDRDDLDYFSAYRIPTYVVAIETIQEQPFFGHGIDQIIVKVRGIPLRIHNVWLKWAVEFGIFMPMWFFFMISIVLARAARIFKRLKRNRVDRGLVTASGLMVIVGIFVSMFEPGVFIASFHNSAIWWAAVGVIWGFYRRRSGHST